MVIMDPISDMLTRMRNALTIGKDVVRFPSSKIKAEIARVLKEEGYIGDFEERIEGSKKFIECQLYIDGKTPITHLEKISKPGRRVYSSKDRIPKVLNGYGLVIISTSKGLMSGKKAKKEGLGGELICKLY
ncbi:MAG: 30S ribosomal protein S8 [Patescibacteria group bacterium]|nr:30S ribosomal protein S8 [Patescibacteria group bacterium]MCL5093969.1 30S ribosomal protein S8 [Patescibacteria group bacterium]